MDLAVFNALRALSGFSTVVDWFTIVLARYLPWAMGIATVMVAVRDPSRAKKLERLIFAALAVLISRGFVTEVVRYLTERPRPFVTLGFEPLIERGATFSFPSGHAAILFALAVVVWRLDRRWGWWFLALASLNGFARVVAGVHWPTDIVVGAVVGVVSALTAQWLLSRIPKRAS
jgi:undecaprenyl-diphosphatase